MQSSEKLFKDSVKRKKGREKVEVTRLTKLLQRRIILTQHSRDSSIIDCLTKDQVDLTGRDEHKCCECCCRRLEWFHGSFRVEQKASRFTIFTVSAQIDLEQVRMVLDEVRFEFLARDDTKVVQGHSWKEEASIV